jgi:NADH dehydrogenase
MTRGPERPTAVVVGGGFAGVGCAKKLARHGVQVTLIDRNNYHQFQPLLYQVATAALGASDIATPLRTLFRGDAGIHFKQAEATGVDPETRTVTTAEGDSYSGDFLVLAPGSRPSFFGTPGAAEHAFPLYSLLDADRLRSRVFAIFEDADRDPRLIEQGALNFVVVGAGPTGVEIAGALADLVNQVLPGEYRDLAVGLTRIYLVELGNEVLAAFSPRARRYAARELERAGVQLRLGVSVKEVAPGHVVLSDGSRISTRCAVWAGGLKAEALMGAGGLRQAAAGASTCCPTSPSRASRGSTRSATPPTSPARRAARCPSSARSRCSRGATPPGTSSPTSTAGGGPASTTATRGSWR